MKHLFYFFLAIFLLANTGCEDSTSNDNNNQPFDEGVFIVNEGQFNNGNASITFYNPTEDTTALEIFNRVNTRPLGDVAQSLTFHDDKAFIVVNNSGKMEVVDGDTFEEIGTVTGLENPRYFLGINDDKAYVSQWGADGVSGKIQVIDLDNNAITSSIDVGGGPEKMYLQNGNVYVGYSGGFGFDQRFTIINPSTDEVIEDVTTNYNPTDMVWDDEGRLWVLSSGYFDFVTSESFPAKITSFDSDHNVLKDFELASTYPADLHINNDGNQLFFIHGGEIVSLDTDSEMLDLVTIASEAFYYGLGYDSDNGMLYATDPLDYTSNGTVYIYNENGNSMGSFTSGISAGNVVIKN